MCAMIKIAFSVLLCEIILASQIDQRQTGDLNVQIDLKNFNIFALTKGKEEYVDYDYAYDYSEMTIKPQNGTTSTTIKPLNSTETAEMPLNKDNSTSTSTITPELELTTVAENASLSTVQTSTNSMMASPLIATATTLEPQHNKNTTALSSAENIYTVTKVADCKRGFFRNNKGNCELKLQKTSNVLHKMLQNSKSSRGNVESNN